MLLIVVAPTKVRGSSESSFEVAATRLCFLLGVKLLHQFEKTVLKSLVQQRKDGHS